MKYTKEEIDEEINNATKEQEIIRRLFQIIKESYFDDHKLLPYFINSFEIDRCLGDDIANLIQNKYPKWFTKTKRIHNSNKTKNEKQS